MRLQDICEINPRIPRIDDDTEVSFVPMTSVSEDGEIDTSDIRPYIDVKKGYTSFKEDDVLFAKITPCMENGKGAIARGLKNGYGCGSSEFHVLRTKGQVMPEWIYYLTSWSYFRREAEKHMTGSAGQRRVPKLYLENYEIRLPELSDQEYQVQTLTHIKEVIDYRKAELVAFEELTKARFVEMFGFPGMDPFKYGKTKLGSCCEINPKKTKDNRLVDNIEISFVPMTAVSEKGEIDSSDVRRYEDVKKGFTYFTEGDVLFAKITPCMENGKGAVAKGLKNRIGFGSTEFHVLRPIDGISNPYWVYAITSFKSFRKEAESNMTGSAGQRRTPVSFLENYEVALPPIELQNQFADFVVRTGKSKAAVQKSLDETQVLFDSLMQKYFG